MQSSYEFTPPVFNTTATVTIPYLRQAREGIHFRYNYSREGHPASAYFDRPSGEGEDLLRPTTLPERYQRPVIHSPLEKGRRGEEDGGGWSSLSHWARDRYIPAQAHYDAGSRDLTAVG